MITRTVRVQLLAFLAISVLGIAYVGMNYVGLGTKLLGRSYTVTVHLPASGGIFPNAEVTERGVAVGRVQSLHLRPDGGVDAVLDLKDGRKIPADTDAVVSDLSAVGEQYVDLEPRVDHGPWLAAGSVIPTDHTRIPLPPQQLLLHLDQLMNSVNKDSLSTTIGELGTAFAGTGPDLQRLIDRGNRLTQTLSDAMPQTVDLIDKGKTVLDTQRAVAGDLRTFSAQLKALSGTIVAKDPQLRTILDAAPDTARQVQGLIQDNQQVLPILLNNLITVGRIQAVPIRLDGLRTIFTVYPDNVFNTFNVVQAGTNYSRFGMVTDNTDNLCKTKAASPNAPGYVPNWRSGAGYDPAKDYGGQAKLNAYCLAPHDAAVTVRGARNAPRPPGDTTDRPPYAPGGGSGNGSGNGNGATTSSAPVTGTGASSLSQPQGATTYDPVTGLLIAPGGEQMTLGETGGQQRYLGADSWKWLLLAPIGG